VSYLVNVLLPENSTCVFKSESTSWTEAAGVTTSANLEDVPLNRGKKAEKSVKKMNRILEKKREKKHTLDWRCRSCWFASCSFSSQIICPSFWAAMVCLGLWNHVRSMVIWWIRTYQLLGIYPYSRVHSQHATSLHYLWPVW
jgi:hypothetical protein